MSAPTISKDESNILVAIGKLETKVDGLTEDITAARAEIKDINSGLANRMLNVEANAVSKIEIMPRMETLETDVQDVKSNIAAFIAGLKVWALLGGGIWSVGLIIISVLVAKAFSVTP